MEEVWCVLAGTRLNDHLSQEQRQERFEQAGRVLPIEVIDSCDRMNVDEVDSPRSDWKHFVKYVIHQHFMHSSVYWSQVTLADVIKDRLTKKAP